MTRRASRDRRSGTLLFVVTVVLLVVAVGTGVAALVVRRDTDDVQAQTSALRRRVRALDATERDAAARVRELRRRARVTNEALTQLFVAVTAQVDASNHAVDIANQAADTYNNAGAGNLAGAFQGAGDAAIAELDTRTQAARSAAQVAQHAIASLEETTDG